MEIVSESTKETKLFLTKALELVKDNAIGLSTSLATGALIGGALLQEAGYLNDFSNFFISNKESCALSIAAVIFSGAVAKGISYLCQLLGYL